VEEKWASSTDAVSLNVAGQALTFLPRQATKGVDGSLQFNHADETASVRAQWSLDPHVPGDVRVTLTLTAKRAGYYSIATPALVPGSAIVERGGKSVVFAVDGNRVHAHRLRLARAMQTFVSSKASQTVRPSCACRPPA
jgi:carbohydrate-selective porin OprB